MVKGGFSSLLVLSVWVSMGVLEVSEECLYVGQEFQEAGSSCFPKAHIKQQAALDLLRYCVHVFHGDVFEAGTCKRPGMPLKFWHNTLPLFSLSSSSSKENSPLTNTVDLKWYLTLYKALWRLPRQARWWDCNWISFAWLTPAMLSCDLEDDGCSLWKLSPHCSSSLFMLVMYNWV